MSVTLSHSYSQSTMHSNHHHGSPSTPSKSTSHLLNHTSLFLDRIEEYFSCGIGVLVFIVSLLSKYLGYPHQFRILPRFSRSVVVVPPSVSLPTLDAPYFTHRRHVQQFMFEFEKSLATEFKHPHLSRFTTQPAYGLQYYPSFTTLSNYTASAQLSRARTDQAQVSQRRNKPQTRTAPAPTVPQVQEPPTPSPSAFPLYVHQKRATLFQHGLYLLSQSVLALQKRFGMRHISATSAETQSSYVDISIPTNILSLYSFISSLSPRHLEPTRPNSEGWNVCFEFDGDSDDTNNLILPPTLNSSDTIHQIHFLAPSFLPTNHL
ncbi:hypothetical protein BLNAU_726 [Blattamonas nauphoetae]|uniref:Uncharacterized protein n=1 Tax=Blattamonas nauphoetae TaxID=2049346 RepID=A0ABQ9YKB6_9EUKA|nr:hypothetical protein BLNAU_726 [Blattamonas nauphoetae]